MAWPSRWPDGIVSSELVTAAWLDDVSTSLAYLERVAAATDVTSNVVVDVTTTGTSQLIIALPATTYEAVPHVLYADGPGIQRTQVATTSPSTFVGIYDGAAASHMGDMCQFQVSSTNVGTTPMHLRHVFTPTAASHTYQIRGYNNTADSWTILAGAGGSGALMPITCSVWRLPIGS